MQNTPEKIGQTLSDKSAAYLAPRLYQTINGRSPAEFNADAPIALQYVDGYARYPKEVKSLNLDSLVSKYLVGVEDLWAHYTSNFSYRVPPSQAGWSNMDRFDAFEDANGVLLSADGVKFTDRSAQAYAGTASVLSRYLYVGYSEPFDQINLVMGNVPGGCYAQWQFWNGSSWQSAVVKADTTNQLTATGSVLLTPQPSWRRTSINNGQRKWWVRLAVSGCSTAPSVVRVYGDDLTTGTVNAFRAATVPWLVQCGY